MLHRRIRLPTLLPLFVAAAVAAQQQQQQQWQPSAEEVLRELASTNFATSRRAARAAGAFRDAAVASALIDVVRSERHQGIRACAAESLGRTGDPRAFDVLAEAARGGPHVAVRQRALVGLAATGDPRAYELLAGAIDDPNVRDAAIEALGLLGDRRVFPRLEAWVREHGPTWRWFPTVARALLAIDRDAAVPLLLGQLPRVEHAGIDGVALVELLRGCRDVPAVRERAIELAADDDAEVREAALGVLGGVGDLRTVSFLFRRLHDDVELRAAVLTALGELGHEFAVDPIAGYVEAGDVEVRLAAVTALGRIGHPTALEPLVASLARAEDVRVAIRAAEGLGRIGDRRALPALAERLLDTRVSAQPLELSRLLPFPYNAHVGDVAWWAARRILDGREPRAVEQLVTAPGGEPQVAESERRALRDELREQLRERRR